MSTSMSEDSSTTDTTHPSLEEISVAMPSLSQSQFRDLLQKRIDEFNAMNTDLLKDVPEEELMFTVEELTALGLDWKTHEMLADYLKKYA